MTCGAAARGDLRPGFGAGRRHHRALSRQRPRSRPRHRPARGVHPRHVRHLDAAAARLRHDAPATCCARDRLRAERLSAGRAHLAPPSPPSRTCSATTGRRRPRSICREATSRSPAPTSPIRKWPTPTSASCARRQGGGDREAEIERARAVWSRASSPKRSTSSAARRM